MKLEFTRQIFENYSNIKFNENPSSGSRVVPCGQAHMTKLTVAFRNSTNAPKKKNEFCIRHTSNLFSLSKLGTCLNTRYCTAITIAKLLVQVICIESLGMFPSVKSFGLPFGLYLTPSQQHALSPKQDSTVQTSASYSVNIKSLSRQLYYRTVTHQGKQTS